MKVRVSWVNPQVTCLIKVNSLCLVWRESIHKWKGPVASKEGNCDGLGMVPMAWVY